MTTELQHIKNHMPYTTRRCKPLIHNYIRGDWHHAERSNNTHKVYSTVIKDCSVHIFHLKYKLETTIHRKAANIFTN